MIFSFRRKQSNPEKPQKNQLPAWMGFLFVAAFLAGLSIRFAFVLNGHQAICSDELFYYHSLQSLNHDQAWDYTPAWNWNYHELRFWIFFPLYSLCGNHLDSIGFIAGTLNLLIYTLWAIVLYLRTQRPLVFLPFLLFMAFPPPCVSCWGTLICEFRVSFLYGALMVGLAGTWFRNPFRTLLLALLAGAGCAEDLFTLFFLAPVLWYERDTLGKGPVGSLAKRWVLLLVGVLASFLALFRYTLMGLESRSGYMQTGFSNPTDWLRHLEMLVKVFPAYWLGGIPWNYLQNSKLGQWLNPMPGEWFQSLSAAVFWLLLLIALAGGFFFFRKSSQKNEAWLWYGPPALFLAFFIFSRQVWDALTLRYLEFFQYFVPVSLAFCVAQDGARKRFWSTILFFWIILHGSALVLGFSLGSGQHPGRYIATRLESLGLRAGFANYWASEPIRYFSKDEVLLIPYDQESNSRRIAEAVRHSEKIALVWLEGLDHPNLWNEVARQIQSLHYRPVSKQEYTAEGWSVTVWEKDKTYPGPSKFPANLK